MEVDLRLILLGLGALVIVGILLDAVRRRKKIHRQVQEFEETILSNKNAGSSQNQKFFVEDDFIADVSEPRPAQTAQVTSRSSQTISHAVEIVAVTIIANSGQNFSGRALNASIQANQLKFGAKRIYHKHRGDQVQSEVLFSLASLTEPGWFEPSKVIISQFRGLILFMDVSSLHDPLPSFDKMLAVARNMANTLGGQICDESRNPLNAQTIEHLKENIRETQRRQLAQEKTLDS